MKNKTKSQVPSTFNVIKREFQSDKVALFALILFVTLLLIIFISS